MFSSVLAQGVSSEGVRVYSPHTPFHHSGTNPPQGKLTQDERLRIPVHSILFLSSHWLLLPLFSSVHRFWRWHWPRLRSELWWWQTEVCELWLGAWWLPRNDNLHFLPAASHDQLHLQSGDVRLAHVLALHLLWVSVSIKAGNIFKINVFSLKDAWIFVYWTHVVFVCHRLVLCCCLIPFFMKRFKDCYHTCPRCNRVLHVEKRKCCKWGRLEQKQTHRDMK